MWAVNLMWPSNRRLASNRMRAGNTNRMLPHYVCPFARAIRESHRTWQTGCGSVIGGGVITGQLEVGGNRMWVSNRW
jgi:hypothetical protein